MSDFLNEKCSLCRIEQTKLFLKGERCSSGKCPVQRKAALTVKPTRGRHGRRRMSEYGLQLREKQKLRKLYGVDEHQFRSYFDKARKIREATGEALMQILETRLDNLIFRLGFAPSRSGARQIVSHGHVTVNGKRVNIPSYLVKPEDIIALSERSTKVPFITKALADKDFSLPEWLERKGGVGRVKRLPTREEIDADISEQIVVEYYSR